MEVIGLAAGILIGLCCIGLLVGAWPQVINAIWPPRMVTFTYHQIAGTMLNVEFRRLWWPWSRYRLTFNKSPETGDGTHFWFEITTGQRPTSSVVTALNGMSVVGANLELEYIESVACVPKNLGVFRTRHVIV